MYDTDDHVWTGRYNNNNNNNYADMQLINVVHFVFRLVVVTGETTIVTSIKVVISDAQHVLVVSASFFFGYSSWKLTQKKKKQNAQFSNAHFYHQIR